MLALLGDRDGVPLTKQRRRVFLQGVARHPGQRDATPSVARSLAARQADRERLGDLLCILLKGLEERTDLIKEYGTYR